MAKYAKFATQLQSLLQDVQSSQAQADPMERDYTTEQAPSMKSRVSIPRAPVQVVTLPFHFHLWNLKGDHSTASSQSLSNLEDLHHIMAGFRRAELQQLGVKLIPNHRALKYPFTVEVMWVPQDRVMTRKILMSSYGMQSFVIGAPLSGDGHISVAADLSTMNPILKDSVNYNDLPKLFMCFRPNEDVLKMAKKKDADGKEIPLPVLCCVALTGIIKLYAPSVSFVDAAESDSSE